MPRRGQGILDKGDLFIIFAIDFPEDNQLSMESIDKLRAILPTMPSEMNVDVVEEVEMEPANLSDVGKLPDDNNRYNYTLSDEEDEGVEQCRQS